MHYHTFDILLFPEKEAKSVVLLRRRLKPGKISSWMHYQSFDILLFPEKEAKSVVLLRRRPNLKS
jgi:hypothetical protein